MKKDLIKKANFLCLKCDVFTGGKKYVCHCGATTVDRYIYEDAEGNEAYSINQWEDVIDVYNIKLFKLSNRSR